MQQNDSLRANGQPGRARLSDSRPTATMASCAAFSETSEYHLAISETVILLHPPLPLVGVSIVVERERQQNDSLAEG